MDYTNTLNIFILWFKAIFQPVIERGLAIFCNYKQKGSSVMKVYKSEDLLIRALGVFPPTTGVCSERMFTTAVSTSVLWPVRLVRFAANVYDDDFLMVYVCWNYRIRKRMENLDTKNWRGEFMGVFWGCCAFGFMSLDTSTPPHLR